jgi:hypothetical protein
MSKIILTPELHNKLIDTAEQRAINGGLKGKKKLEMQYELLIGAMRCIDLLNGETETCLPPGMYFSMIRGELIKKIEIKPTQS